MTGRTRFLSTPSARRATQGVEQVGLRHIISIHALCEEGDASVNHSSYTGWQFLSTPSARRATTEATDATETKEYFYPRPLRGGRRSAVEAVKGGLQFLSTPSARRATCRKACAEVDRKYFYPRPLRGGRPWPRIVFAHESFISIHALCEEGDTASSARAS